MYVSSSPLHQKVGNFTGPKSDSEHSWRKQKSVPVLIVVSFSVFFSSQKNLQGNQSSEESAGKSHHQGGFHRV